MEEPEKTDVKEEGVKAASVSGKVSEEFREYVSRMGILEVELMTRLAGFVPGDFVDHLLNARKEALLAFRSLIDAAIERTEDRRTAWDRLAPNKGAAPGEAAPRKVPLE